MTDELRGGSAARSKIPNLYSSLLETQVGGHALWRPRDCFERGGEVGDCGYIADGLFWKLFNVYRDPPAGLPALPSPLGFDVDTVRVPNVSPFQSSQSSSVAFEASLPLSIPPANVSITGRMASTDTAFAFLACSGPCRLEETLSRVQAAKVQRYLFQHYATLQQHGEGDIFIVRTSVRASGWVGGVAFHSENNYSANASFAIPGVGDVAMGGDLAFTSGTSATDAAHYQKIAGPADWSYDTPETYPVILGAVKLRKRDHLRRLLGSEMIAVDDKPTTSTSNSLFLWFRRLAHRIAKGRKENTAAVDSNNGRYDGTGSSSQLDPGLSLNSNLSEADRIGLPSLLDLILDDVLDCVQELDVAVGDSALVSDFLADHSQPPRPGELGFEWEEDATSAPEVVAFVTKLNPTEPRLVYADRESRSGRRDLFKDSSLASDSNQVHHSVLRIEDLTKLVDHNPNASSGALRWVDSGSFSFDVGISYTSTLSLQNVEFAKGTGKTRRDARMDAAQNALDRLDRQHGQEGTSEQLIDMLR